MNIWAGGIITYNENLEFLLGQERYNKKWSGFVGKFEPSDRNIINTAIREFNEETAKIFEEHLELIHTKIVTGDCKLVVDNNNDKLIYIWFIKFPSEILIDIENKFLKNLKDMKDIHFQEKISLKWFTIQDIRKSKNEILYKLKKAILNNYQSSK